MQAWWLKLRAATGPLLGFRSQPPLALFTAWFTYFIASQYFIESSFLYRAGFYVTVLVFIALWIRWPGQVHAIPRHFGARSLATLGLFIIFHALVISQGEGASKTLRDLATNGVFVLMCLTMFCQDDAVWDRFIRVFLVVVAASAVISLLRYCMTANLLLERLSPIGRHANPLLGANMHGFALMMALAVVFRPHQPRWLYGVAATLLVLVPVLTFLSQSRGPMLAQIIGVGLACIVFRRYRLLALLVLAALLGAGALLYARFNPGVWPMLEALQAKIEFMLVARDSMRLQIWQYTLGMIEQRPWTGYGLRNIFFMESAPTVVNPHNIFLSAAYYTGWPGLVMLLAPLAASFVYAWRDHSWYGRLCLLLLVHGVVALFTDGAHPIKSPAPMWTLYWLPLAMAMTRPQKVSVGQA